MMKETMRRKLLLFLILAFVLLCIIVISVFIIQLRSTEQSSLAPVSSQPDGSQTRTNTEPVTQPEDTFLMGTASFAIRLSHSWSAVQQPYTNGESVLITPTDSGKEANKSLRITVEKNDTETRMQELNRFYAGYKAKDAQIFGNQAIEFSGESVAPFNGKLVPIQDTVYIIRKNATVYIVNYHYVSDVPVPEIESEFKSLVSTLEIY